MSETCPAGVLRAAVVTLLESALCGGGGVAGVGLAPSQLHGCCAVLALPDGFARCDGSALLQLLLVEMGMRACLVAEEARPSLASPSGI